jgi:hypothetical protein
MSLTRWEAEAIEQTWLVRTGNALRNSSNDRAVTQHDTHVYDLDGRHPWLILFIPARAVVEDDLLLVANTVP